MFSANQTYTNERKDTVVNAEATGRFIWNLATWDLRDAVNITSEQLPPDVDEFEVAGLEKEKAKLSDVPMVKRSPVKFECEYHTTFQLPGNPPAGSVDIVIGRVVAIHIADEVLTDGILDVKKTQPIARCGYHQYAVVKEVFEMAPPGNVGPGLEGNAKLLKEEVSRERG